jgi:hypothetical protein
MIESCGNFRCGMIESCGNFRCGMIESCGNFRCGMIESCGNFRCGMIESCGNFRCGVQHLSRILVVDDQAVNRTVAVAMLHRVLGTTSTLNPKP